ncbi:MAG TPA: glycosyltransferase [Acidimicrobiales bacterium]|nr:glycosyltransferase [Acidimicrobiales bacterium]
MDETPGMTGSPRISVVVPTVDRVALLERTLRGLAAQDAEGFEAIVVHDGDAAIVGLLDHWQDRLPLRALHIAERGAVAKRNAGWRAASAPLIAFTDDDCEPAPGWLKAALAAFDDGDPRVDLVQGRVDTHPEDAHVDGLFKRSVEVHQHYEGYPNANLIYRRRALERVGGYDDAYWGASEDSDLAFRVIETGGEVRYVDDAVVWHAVRPVGFFDHLKSLPRWANGPLTMKRHPQLRPLVHHRIFWKPMHTSGALALLGLVLAPFNWRLAALVAPHFARRIRGAGIRGGTQLALADIAEVAVTVAGSLRYRTVFI